MADSLKQRAISGALWSGIHKFSITLLGFISGVVLARLLTPHDYGVIGMLTIFIAVSNTFIDGGFGSALIQKKRPTNEDYSTILYWNLGLSVVLYVILYASAPTIARFYDLSLLTEVLRVQGVVLIINAARIVQRTQLRKQLAFKRIAIINVSSNIVALLVTIVLAAMGWGVWSLVVQQLLLCLLTTILYWITSKWRPMLVFSWTSFKELFSFGGFILLSNLFNTFCNNVQGLLIGKVYNSSTLGYYTKSRRTEGYASTFISSVLDQVSYPVFSESQYDKPRMIRVLKQFIGASAFLTFPLMFLLILLAKPLFILLYSEKWLDSVPYFQLLCIAGIAISLQNVNYYAVAALGKSKQLFKWTFVKRLLGLFLVFFGLWLYGLYGLLIGTVLTSWLIYIINGWLVSKYVGYSLKKQFADLFPVVFLSGMTCTFTYMITFWGIHNLYIDGLVKMLVFIAIYISSSVFLQLETFLSAKNVLTALYRKLRPVRVSN